MMESPPPPKLNSNKRIRTVDDLSPDHLRSSSSNKRPMEDTRFDKNSPRDQEQTDDEEDSEEEERSADDDDDVDDSEKRSEEDDSPYSILENMVITGCILPPEFINEHSGKFPDELNKLIAFDKSFNSKTILINQAGDIARTEDMITDLHFTFKWKWCMRMYLYYMIKALKPPLKTSKGELVEAEWESSISDWTNEAKGALDRVSKLLKGFGISSYDSDREELNVEMVEDPETSTLEDEASFGCCVFRHSIFENNVRGVVKKIKDFYKNKRAEANEEQINFSEEDIICLYELVEQFPSTDPVENQIKKLVLRLVPDCPAYTEMARQLYQDMEATSRAMITLRAASLIGVTGIQVGKRALPRTIEEILDSLLEQVDLFKQKWEKRYSSRFGKFSDDDKE